MHTGKELTVMEEYEKSVDEDIYRFVRDVMDGDDRINCITVAFLTERAARDIEALTGKTVEGNRVVLDISAVKHIIKRHGENGEMDNSMRNIDDIARIGYVISNYDEIKYEGRTAYGYLDENSKPSPLVRLSKKIDGTFYVVEAVNSSKNKKNYVVSAYINKKKKTAI